MAIELLREASTDKGFVASPAHHDNYRRVWTRDGVVCGLAALMSGDNALTTTFRRTLCTVLDHQHSSGFVPSSVGEDGTVSFGGTVGRADNPSWAVIGMCQYLLFTNDEAFREKYRTHIEKCFHVLDIWEYNGKHLVYVPQSGDWADEYMYHGYLLFDQLLRLWALRLASRVFQREDWRLKADTITTVIQNDFWNHKNLSIEPYAPNLRHQLTWAPTEYWFMGFNPSRIYDQFDLQANAMALFLDLGKTSQTETTSRFIFRLMSEFDSIVPSFYPCIMTTDPDMMDLSNNYAYRFRNHPYEFHNGGLWPVWNGLLACALVKAGHQPQAEELLEKINTANAQSEWEFNECLHGLNKKTIGTKRCTWSAAGAVIAERSLSGTQLFS